MSINCFNPKDSDYYCLVKCFCDRVFQPSELYICFICNEIRCKYCVHTEYEYFQCKNNCKPLTQSEEKSKDTKNCCDSCLECPLCFTPLSRREVAGNFFLLCPSCYWSTKEMGLEKNSEKEFKVLIEKLNEEFCSSFLKRMFNSIQEKLNKDPIFLGGGREKKFEYKNLSIEEKNPLDEIVNKAMNGSEWKSDQLIEDIKKNKNLYEKLFFSKLEYKDDYYLNEGRKYMSFLLVNKLISSYADYTEKFDSLEALQKNLDGFYNVNNTSSLEQRHKSVIFQNTSRSLQFPRFVDLIPKKAKSVRKCGKCGKVLVEAGENLHKGADIKYAVLNSFISQFPTVTIYKIDTTLNVIVLKFTLYFDKDIAIKFKECDDSDIKVEVPQGKYNFKDYNEKDVNSKDEGLYGRKENIILFNFKVKQESQGLINVPSSHYFKFFVEVDYTKDDFSSSTIEYQNEIKFKGESK